MVIPQKYIDNFTRLLNGISEDAKKRMAQALQRITLDDIAVTREEIIAAMNAILGPYSMNAAALSATFYDGLRELFGISDGFTAEAVSSHDPKATEGAVRSFMRFAVDDNAQALSNALLGRIDYEIKKTANECVEQNAIRDPKKPKWARIPTGAETCAFCIMLASRGFDYNSKETASHAHANCVVAETEVAGIGLLAGMGREYKGTLVNIRTRGGRNLTVTPNHPILTTRGWVIAGEIKEFDNLVCANFIHGDNGSVPYINDVPPTAKEVFESCSFVYSTLFDSVPVATENLNGEIIGDSNIKVINPLGFLKRAIEATSDEPIEHCGFSVTQSDGSISCPLFDSFRACNLFGFGNDSTSDGIMSSGGLSRAFFGGHGRSADNPSFGLIACGDSGIRKPSDDCSTADVEAVSDGINALTIIERFENSIRHWDALTTRLDAIASEYTKNGCFTASDFLDNLFSGSARLIEIDDVESVSFSEQSCHVYNLSTKGGWYVSSGIITHNCDCCIVPSWDKDPRVENYGERLDEYRQKYERADELRRGDMPDELKERIESAKTEHNERYKNGQEDSPWSSRNEITMIMRYQNPGMH